MPRTTPTRKPQIGTTNAVTGQSNDVPNNQKTGRVNSNNQTLSSLSIQCRADYPSHMWDGDGPDEFPTIDGIKPPFKRSEIERPKPINDPDLR